MEDIDVLEKYSILSNETIIENKQFKKKRLWISHAFFNLDDKALYVNRSISWVIWVVSIQFLKYFVGARGVC